MSEERNYYEELKINKFQLEEEWIQQSEKAMYWAERAATAQREYEDVELERKILKAELYKKYRRNLEEEKVKVTDTMIEAFIRTDPEYKEISEKLIAAKENASVMDSAKWNFMTRKNSLEKIQEGIITGLFSDPRDINQADYEKQREAIKQRRKI
jgi:hypothetical protein